MKIFLVRHGQTAGNISQRHQTSTIELTPKGREQAQATAQRLLELRTTHLISSPLTRALQTTQAISTVCSLTPEVSKLFSEVDRPDTFHGRHRKDLYSIWFYLRWFFESKTVVKDGGETYSALRQRIVQAQEKLASYPEDARVVVVSHAVFINFFLVHMCNPRALSLPAVLRCLRSILKLQNGAIIPIDYNPKTQKCHWQVEK